MMSAEMPTIVAVIVGIVISTSMGIIIGPGIGVVTIIVLFVVLMTESVICYQRWDCPSY